MKTAGLIVIIISARAVLRRIFAYNICLISISDTVSDGATKTLELNIEMAHND